MILFLVALSSCCYAVIATSCVGLNEGHYMLIISTSLYVNTTQVYSAGLWDKCTLQDNQMWSMMNSMGHSKSNV